MTRTYPPAILAIGKNYADHAAELGGEAPSQPVLFFKNPASLIASGEPILLPPVVQTPELGVDYEGELAVILACDAKDVPEAEARSVIETVAVANDVSQRWWQWQAGGSQWCRGKSFDSFCPLSEPVPIGLVPDLQNLQITTKLNGDVMQNGHTGSMIFSVARLIAELSRGTTLLKGSVILTGTPPGVGAAQKPARFLRDGDRVSVAIEGVGAVHNPVCQTT